MAYFLGHRVVLSTGFQHYHCVNDNTVHGSPQTVLTATSHSCGNCQNSTPTKFKPSTDYNKTLHNWMRSWDKHMH